MEMHQLRYFAAVARLGNFSRAAEECRVAQPSLSQQILKLEDEVGERLRTDQAAGYPDVCRWPFFAARA
jgi:LysR family transcriptional regulator, hydrogen peroxide-inducible genes activator